MSEGTNNADVDPLIGRVFASRYQIEARLGAGAMGAVYRARHVKVGRPFAVKMLHERYLVDEKQRRRFEREAELAGKLHHINVIGVVDVGETEDGIHFMVMEFAVGAPLTDLMTGPIEASRAIHIAQQLCDGLQHAHDHGLIHRDFKPDNVIVERDGSGAERPRIVDFGISILRDEAGTPGRAERLTTAGLILGTPHYMAPEHAMGAGIDHRIDLFALGVILYELLTGQLPFDGDGVDVARANLMMATPAMGVRVPGVVVDPLLEAFTRRLMEKDPAHRPQSAKEAREILNLISRDRSAAAIALGVELPETPRVEARPALLPRATSAPIAARAAIVSTPSTRALTVPEKRAESEAGGAELPVAGETTRPVRRTTEPSIAPPRRLWAVTLGAALVIGIAAIVGITGRGERSTTSRAPGAPDTAHAAIASAEPAAIDAGAHAPIASAEPAAIDAGAHAPDAGIASAPVDTAPAIAAATAAVPIDRTVRPLPRPKPRPKKDPQPVAVVAAVADPMTASTVAQLYGTVGRELKLLDTQKGSAATASMWPRYLRIKINDVLTTVEKRAEAYRLLTSLRKEIAAQR